MARIDRYDFPIANAIDPYTKKPVYGDPASLITGGASIVSGLIGSDAASSAADASASATRASNAMIQAQQGQNSAAYKPYTDLGANANNKLSYYLGLTPSSSKGATPSTLTLGQSGNSLYDSILQNHINAHQAQYGIDWNTSRTSDSDRAVELARIQAEYNAQAPDVSLDKSDGNYGSLLHNFDATDLANDPVYNSGLQFGLDQGVQGLNRQAASTGSLNSGATLKALTRYANDYGSTKAQGAYNNFNTNKSNIYNMLSGQSAQGLSATSGLQGNNSNLLTGAASNVINNGNNQGNAAVSSGAAWGNAINGGIGNYLYNNRTNGTPMNTPIAGNSTFGSGSNNGGGGISLSNYTNSIPWYAQG